MAKLKRDSAERDVGNPHRQEGIADQGGFEDELGTVPTGGGLDQGGLAKEGAFSGAPSEAELMVNRRNRPVEDEAAYDEAKDLRPGITNDRPLTVDKAHED